MVAAQDFRNLVDGLFGIFFFERRTGNSLQVRDSQDALLHRGVGGKDEVVLVHAHRVIALALQDTDYLERKLLETDNLADGILTSGEKVIDNGFTDEADLGCGGDVLFGEHIAVFHFVAADIHVVGRDAIDCRRRIVRSVDDLSTAIDRGGDQRDVARFVADILVVFQLEGLHIFRALTNAATHVATRLNHNHVRPHLAYLRLDTLLRTLADGEHGDDRGDPDNNTEHRQETAQLVVCQGADGYLE